MEKQEQARSNVLGGLVEFSSLSSSIDRYFGNGGMKSGLSTGWESINGLLKLEKGLLMVVTGIPSSGKSEWLDQLMLHTIAMHEWHWTVFSPENWPLEHHFQKLAEKWTGKPMFHHPEVASMTREDVEQARADLSGPITFIEPPEHNLTIDPILDLLLKSKNEHDTDAFLLDPWNELEHHRPPAMSETEYIGQALTKLRNFGRRHKILMCIVAHPTKLNKDDEGKYPVPTPYDINGSANWRNKADVCVSVWRDYAADNGLVEIHVQKIRNKNLGKLGSATLFWNRPNGLFFDDHLQSTEAKHGIVHRL